MQLMFSLKGNLKMRQCDKMLQLLLSLNGEHEVVERKVDRNLHDNVSTLNEQSTMQSTSTTKSAGRERFVGVLVSTTVSTLKSK